MQKRLFVISLLCTVALPITFAANRSENASPDSRPNILMIFTDDHAYQAISAYGSNRNVTPNMDRLANEGMRFTNCVVPNSICGPVRAVIQTGKYSHINGFIDNSSKFDISQQTFPKLLQKAGYQTAVVGKWHLACDAMPGYDYSEVLIGQGPYFNPTMIKNGVNIKHEGYTTEIITDLTIHWLENRDKSKPFLMMSQHKAPHREWSPIKKHYDKFKDVVFPEPETLFDDYSGRGRAAIEQDMTIAETMTPFDLKLKGMPANLNESQKAMWQEMFAPRIAEFERLNLAGDELTRWKYQCYMRDYLSCVDAVDESVGQILKYLDDSGLADNTIVVYASDQGFYLGEHGWFDKRFMFNESFKTPLLVRWPGKTKPGSVNNDIVSLLDLPETFLEVAGAAIPDDMQGLSLVPVLKGETPDDWRKSFYYHYYEYPGGSHAVKRHEGVYDGRFKLIHFYNDIDEWELYDNATDPLELQNVIDEPQYKDDVARLRTELIRLRDELKVPDNVIATDAPLNRVTPNRPYINWLRTVIQEREARQATRARSVSE